MSGEVWRGADQGREEQSRTEWSREVRNGDGRTGRSEVERYRKRTNWKRKRTGLHEEDRGKCRLGRIREGQTRRWVM